MALAISVSVQGCYGSFAATKALHSWNGKVSGNKFVNTLVFWGLIIIPVYGLFTLGDGIIFNVIEFWGGSNPIAMGEDVKTEMLADGGVRFTQGEHVYVLRPGVDDSVTIEIDGQYAGHTWTTEDGGMVMFDARTGRTQALDGQGVAQLRDALDGHLADQAG